MLVRGIHALLLATAFAASSHAQSISIAGSPSVSIGRDGDVRSLFTMVLGAWQAPNGEILVLDPSPPSPIRAFKPDGKFSRVVSRNGEGPGELGAMVFAAHRSGETLVISELNRRISTFGLANGATSASRLQLKNAPGRAVVAGLLPGNRWLVMGVAPVPREHADGPFRDTTWFGIATAGGDSAMMLGRTASIAWYTNNAVAGPSLMQRVRYDSLMPSSVLLSTGNRIVVADAAAPTILVFDADGKALKAIDQPFPTSAYDRAELTRARAMSLALAKTASDSGFLAAMFDRRVSSAPRFKRIISGADGELWIEKFWLDESKPREFAVLDRNGTLVGRVSGAPAIRYTEFGRDYALGVATDADDAHIVVRYAVTRR